MPDGAALIGPTALILAWWSCLMALRLSGLQKFIAIYCYCKSCRPNKAQPPSGTVLPLVNPNPHFALATVGPAKPRNER
ncbi:hypothetical protein Y917_09920 [Salmonella enterica subsp. enterica serovar Agona]|nr:hypothetical protein [Salmonella enterica subsp. enterica serovar Agona]